MSDLTAYREQPWWPLAASVSLAPRVEPLWLRAARVTLHPTLGTESEQQIWFSDLVRTRSLHGVVFKPESLDALREDLQKKGRVQASWEVLNPLLKRASPLWHLEAQLVTLCYSDTESTEQARDLLRQVLRAMSLDPSPALALWARRVLPQLPMLAHMAETWAIAVVAGTRLGSPLKLKRETAPDLAGIPWTELLPPNLRDIEIGVRRDGKYLQISRNHQESKNPGAD